MERFETRVDDGILELEGADGWITVGSFDEVVAELGETYEIEYDEEERVMPWLHEAEEGILTIEVPETLRSLSFDEEFIGLVEGTPESERVTFFVDMIRQIWDSKGNLD